MEPDEIIVQLPATSQRWHNIEVAELVGKRFYADVGEFTFVGTVSFAGASGDLDDVNETASHVELKLKVEKWSRT